ncbi:MAG: RNA 2'-phosphotransferase [Candidatus Hadarchaeia archaeon]
MDRQKVSKYMAYLLRHNPSGLDISRDGFADLDSLLEKLRERWDDMELDDVQEIVDSDLKGRYEINAGKIRAKYGHSIDVDPCFSEANKDVLFHGTTPSAAKKIMREGLKPSGRKRVHLSKERENALKVGKRRSDNPVLLKIDAQRARDNGIRIERASEEVFVAEPIPPEFIEICNNDESVT